MAFENVLGELTYESWTAVTQSLPFLIAIGVVLFLPLLIWLIIASTTRARTSDGRKTDKVILNNPNAFLPFIIFGFITAIFMLLLLIFPVFFYFIN